MYTSPFITGILYRKGYFTPDGLVTLTKLVSSVGVILIVSYCIRGLGRASNPTYMKFIETLLKIQSHPSEKYKRELAVFDFDFSAWPVDYDWHSIDR